MVEIDYFAKLGSMLGFSVFTEDTIDSQSRPMDLTWWDGYDEENKQWTELILHLERENRYDKDHETLIKLFKDNRKFKPHNVIGILNVRNESGAEELVKEAEKLCKVPNALLIIRIYPEVKAYLFNENKKVQERTAYFHEVQDILFLSYDQIITTERVKPEP